jgi:hypothetical protein
MRLLEFNLDEGGANPQHLPPAKKRPKSAVRPARAPQKPALAAAHQRAKVFPVKTNTTRKPAPARRSPIDIEQLQQRIVALELRIRERVERREEQIPARELVVLKQRVQLLERNVNNELWAAKQREYTMLQLLSRPTLKTRIHKQLMRFREHTLPAIGNWLKTEGREWWQHSQPHWWPKFAKAWQESLEQARR